MDGVFWFIVLLEVHFPVDGRFPTSVFLPFCWRSAHVFLFFTAEKKQDILENREKELGDAQKYHVQKALKKNKNRMSRLYIYFYQHH